MRLLRQLDRLLLAVPDVPAWYDYLTEGVRLPAAWPPTQCVGGGVTSAGVYAGDVVLELLQSRDVLLGHAPAAEPALIGIAFLAGVDFDDLPVILSTFGLESHYENPLPLTTLPTLVLDGLLAGAARLVIAHHAYDTQPWLRHLHQEFMASGGGPLGLTGVAAVVVGLCDVERRHSWRPLRPGRDVTGDSLRFDLGPALRFVEHPHDALLAIEMEVRRLADAVDVLADIPLPPGAERQPEGLRLGVLEVRLVERG